MPTICVDVELHPGQERLLRERVRFNVAACGRRWGKSVFAELLMTETAGEQCGRVGYFAPQYKLLAETWRDLDADLGPVLVERSLTERRMKLATGGVIEMWSLEDMDAGRSRRYNRVIIDEAGLVPHLGESWERAIRPTLADLRGDAWFLGTPKGRNFFYRAHQLGQDKLQPEWQSWQMSTAVNPWIAPSEIEAMRRSMSERSFAQEVLAEFLDDAGGVFRFVRESSIAEPQDRAIEGHAYTIGCDWARTGDFSVFSVLDETAKAIVHIDRFTGVEYHVQRARLRALWERFAQPVILAESNSMGGPVVEELRREGLPVQPFVTSNATKGQIIDALALALERREITIINDPVLVAELESYEAERLPSGTVRYGAPEGMHDDTVIATALAWWAACPANQWVMV